MQSTALIGWFADLTLADRPTVGGKGGSLGELTRAGIAVPGGFVVRTAAFDASSGNWSSRHRCARVSRRWLRMIWRASRHCLPSWWHE